MLVLTKSAIVLYLFMLDGEGAFDVLGAVIKEEGKSNYTFKYRFRYYIDENVINSSDTKRFYEVSKRKDGSPIPESDLVEFAKTFTKGFAEEFNGEVFEINGPINGEEAGRIMMEQNFTHISRVKSCEVTNGN